MSKRPVLQIMSGDDAGHRYEVKSGGLRFGRSSSNDVHIPDEELSRNHCLFEAVGESGLRVTDLASANGTYLNGKLLGSDPAELEVGDRVVMGQTLIKVVSAEEPVAPAIDLGLGTQTKVAPPKPTKRSWKVKALWIAVGALVVVAIVCVWLMSQSAKESDAANVVTKIGDEAEQRLSEFTYEKVEADSRGIFRYALSLSANGVLTVNLDDVPGENRHVSKAMPLGDTARAALNEILAYETLREIDREYVGVEPDPPELKSWQLKVVYCSKARTVKVVNIAEPEAFRRIREKLEAFSKNELGIWAIQYSTEKMIDLAKAEMEVGREKWDDRDVHLGNLFAAATAYKEALFYLETINPKPAFAEEAMSMLRKTEEELDRRYKERRFNANRVINMKHWEEARQELRSLIEMIPDRADDRNREASARLVDVEKRIKKGGR